MNVIAPSRAQWLRSEPGSGLKRRYTDRLGQAEGTCFSDSQRKTHFVRKAAAEAVGDYLSRAVTCPSKKWILHALWGQITALSMNVLWIKRWRMSACLSLICNKSGKAFDGCIAGIYRLFLLCFMFFSC